MVELRLSSSKENVSYIINKLSLPSALLYPFKATLMFSRPSKRDLVSFCNCLISAGLVVFPVDPNFSPVHCDALNEYY